MSINKITMKQLECLLAVEQTEHFRRAAERVKISQPALSAQIQNLEEVLGVKIVERGRSGVAMTPLGREILHHARVIIDERQAMLDLAHSSKGNLIGTIKLGTSATLGPYLLPHVVSSLHRKHQDLNLYVRESASLDLEYDLNQGVHDMIISQLPTSSSDHIFEKLFREPLFLTLARDHPLAKKPTINISDLKGLDILSLGPQYYLFEQISSLCETFGTRLLRDYEGTSLDALRQMVGMGMGAAFLPAMYVQSEITARSEVVVRNIKGRTITRTVGLVWRKSAGRAQSYRTIATLIRDVATKKFEDLVLEMS